MVLPLKIPERISTLSSSLREVEISDNFGLRLSTSLCTISSLNSSPGGQPSTTTPIHLPWLSPKHVTAKFLPIELADSYSSS